jgi:hypothetical protein
MRILGPVLGPVPVIQLVLLGGEVVNGGSHQHRPLPLLSGHPLLPRRVRSVLNLKPVVLCLDRVRLRAGCTPSDRDPAPRKKVTKMDDCVTKMDDYGPIFGYDDATAALHKSIFPLMTLVNSEPFTLENPCPRPEIGILTFPSQASCGRC